MHSSGVTTEIRYKFRNRVIYRLPDISECVSATLPSERKLGAKHARLNPRGLIPPRAVSLSPLATRGVPETRPFKGCLSRADFVLRARPRRRQSEHGCGCAGAVAQRARSGLEAEWSTRARAAGSEPGRLRGGDRRPEPSRQHSQAKPAAPGGCGAGPGGRLGGVLHRAVAPACPGSPRRASSHAGKPELGSAPNFGASGKRRGQESPPATACDLGQVTWFCLRALSVLICEMGTLLMPANWNSCLCLRVVFLTCL